ALPLHDALPISRPLHSRRPHPNGSLWPERWRCRHRGTQELRMGVCELQPGQVTPGLLIPGRHAAARSTRRTVGQPTRRQLLAGTLGLAGVIAGCDPADPLGSTDESHDDLPDDATVTPTPEPDPDLAFLEAGLATEDELLAAYDATVATHADLAEFLGPLIENHRAHRAYLTALVETAGK